MRQNMEHFLTKLLMTNTWIPAKPVSFCVHVCFNIIVHFVLSIFLHNKQSGKITCRGYSEQLCIIFNLHLHQDPFIRSQALDHMEESRSSGNSVIDKSNNSITLFYVKVFLEVKCKLGSSN